MLFTLTLHEIRHRLGQVLTHVYFGIFFLLAFLIMNALGGAFSDAQIFLLGMGPNTYVNSPFAIGLLSFLFSLLGMMITAPFMGQAVYRDFDSGMDPLVFTTPVTKGQYLGGRFLGSLIVHLYLYVGVTLGLYLGTVVPWVDPTRFGPTMPLAYLQPYLVFLIPNLVFAGAIFFGLPALTRKMLPNYIGGVLLFMGYNIAQALIGGDAIQNSTIASYLDPFGNVATANVTRYWTAAEQNAQLIPLEGALLVNRLLWLVIGLTIAGAVLWRFRFAHRSGTSDTKSDESDAPKTLADVSPTSIIHAIDLPRVDLSESFRMRLTQFWSLTKRGFLNVVKDVYFYAIVAASMIFLVIVATESGTTYGTPVQPITYQVLEGLNQSFTIFAVILITFYAGQLVWQERDADAAQVYDALPLPSGLSLAAKGASLVGMLGVLMLVVLVTGVGTQLAFGFTDIDVSLYLTELYGVSFVGYLTLIALALTIQSVVNHKYFGHFLMVAFFMVNLFSTQIGLEHNLWRFGSDPGTPYSDMNEYGHFLYAFSWHQLVWTGVSVMMLVAARLAWVRGMDTSLSVRLKRARKRLTPSLLATLGAGTVVALLAGGFVFVSTTVWNPYYTSDEAEQLQVDYEKTYRTWLDVPQPRIDAVDLDVDLYPYERDARYAGAYVLVNDRDRPVDSLLVEVPSTSGVERMEFGRPVTKARQDDALDVYVYRFDTPLAPGDSTTLDFALWDRNDGFTNSGNATTVVYNGTFSNSSAYLPHFGYNLQREVSNRNRRRSLGLPERPRMYPRSDTAARMRPYVSRDATWLRYEATVSTAGDQTALAPGTLDSTWTTTEDGAERRHFRYRTTAPTLGFFSFLSARYAVETDTWTPPSDTINGGRPVGVEVYYHPEHDFNIERIQASVKHSLDYYTTHFGPYQSDQVRVAEFPRYASFAQSFLGTIPYSESIGFVARVDPETNVDYPYYVTAHEMAHQWWAHQVVSGPVYGATMLVETLSQYSALMVMEERYGRKAMKEFLEYELDQYLNGRSTETREEKPLIDVTQGQTYIHYRKGSLAMYALKEYLGEDVVNRTLREFLQDHRFETPPYTTSEALVERFEAAAPDSLRPFVSDLFREVTLYDQRATEATYTETEDGRYRVDLTVSSRKLQADSLGTEQEVEMNDYVEIGVFGADAEVTADEQTVLYRRKHKLTSGEQTITVTVDEEPARAGVDPYTLLVDRNTDDNLTGVEQADG